MVSMGMKLRFLYPCVTRVKINNRAFYTNVSVRENLTETLSGTGTGNSPAALPSPQPES